jgi:hypothetical protein
MPSLCSPALPGSRTWAAWAVRHCQSVDGADTSRGTSLSYPPQVGCPPQAAGCMPGEECPAGGATQADPALPHQAPKTGRADRPQSCDTALRFSRYTWPLGLQEHISRVSEAGQGAHGPLSADRNSQRCILRKSEMFPCSGSHTVCTSIQRQNHSPRS